MLVDSPFVCPICQTLIKWPGSDQFDVIESEEAGIQVYMVKLRGEIVHEHLEGGEAF